MTENTNSIIHLLSIYDAKTEELVELLKFKEFNLNAFIEQFAVDPVTDPEMHERYAIGPDDLPLILDALGHEYNFEFQAYAYFVEAVTDD